jgi:IclR family mhp operon transcriptional activator
MQPKPIRAFSRGLAVIEALNHHGTASALQLARESGVPRPTVYRLLQTLIDAGYVARGVEDDRFHLRQKIRGLSGGFKDEHWIADVAAPLLMELTERIAWPCDVCTLEGLQMVIRDTTHFRAPLSIDRNMVGRHLPLLATASGLAYIAFVPADERRLLLELLAQSDSPADAVAKDFSAVARLIANTRRRGYGVRQGGTLWPHTGSVALPIRHGKRVLGCINAIWMARVIGFEEGVRRCLAPLQQTRASIEERLRN